VISVLSEAMRRKTLETPSKPISIILDTDAKNEIDDQFAIVYSLLSPDDVHVEAFHAAPFKNLTTGYPDPALGMEASYQEICRLLDTMDVADRVSVFRGSRAPLTSPDTPQESDAAENLVRLAMRDRETPLYVVAIGAVTNVVSAILMAPEIRERIVVMWLGAHPPSWDWRLGARIGCPNHFEAQQGYGVGGWEFNLSNDPLGAMALFDSGVPLVWVPCKNVAEHLRTVPSEIEQFIRHQGAIGDYLAGLFEDWMRRASPLLHKTPLSKVLWDLAPIAYLIHPEWVPTELAPTPRFDADNLLKLEAMNPFGEIGLDRHSCRIAVHVHRDPIFSDLFQKLEKFAQERLFTR
jgi:purine nucleosidase